jgi:hypothetical protein
VTTTGAVRFELRWYSYYAADQAKSRIQRVAGLGSQLNRYEEVAISSRLLDAQPAEVPQHAHLRPGRLPFGKCVQGIVECTDVSGGASNVLGGQPYAYTQLDV